ncbi:hypothetical protein Dda_8065 [Drechslerella dactyloides]|uniref:Short-chain dehydrogenase/reductase family protein n=1 Tax=Drechslerella dactyloides TaxID=74499 RepID=A0AAD6ISJ4_DREDA|nr:hypothetical protein Dda_8065 [Drechslerella dactyloides]
MPLPFYRPVCDQPRVITMSVPSSRERAPLTSNYWRRFWRSQHTKPPTLPTGLTLAGKTAIITGSNVGLGLETARLFLSHRLSHLIMAVRSTTKGEAAATALRQQFPSATIEVWMLDMSSYESIQAFAARVNSPQLARLDIAILNAGVGTQTYKPSPITGHEEMMQVNYLSTFLLAILLIPALKNKSPAGTPGRMTIVSSALANITPLPDHASRPLFTAIDDPKNFGNPSYGVSKLLGHMFLWKFSEGNYVSADEVVINMIEPGFLRGTSLNREVKGASVIALKLLQALAGREVTDATTVIIDAAEIKGKEAHLCYLADWEIRPFPPFLYTQEGRDATDKLWGETMAEWSFADIKGVLERMKG